MTTPSSGESRVIECVFGSDESRFYFPVGALHPRDTARDRLDQCLYSLALEAMGEPRLSGTRSADDEVYRFLWLRSFDCPIAVRAERRTSGGTLTATALERQRGFDPGPIVFQKERAIAAVQWEELRSAVDAACFWTLDSHSEWEGLDGARWVLEGVRAEHYHVAHRWSPRADVDGALRAACLWLLDVARIGLYAEPVY